MKLLIREEIKIMRISQKQSKLWEIPMKLRLIEFLALSISAGVSTFGLYTILQPLLKTEQVKLIVLLVSFVGFFILIDRLRRSSLVGFLNSQLSQTVEAYLDSTINVSGKEVNLVGTKTKWLQGIFGVILTVVILGSDWFGGYSIYAIGKQNLVEYHISRNQVYQKEVNDISTGKSALEQFNMDISNYNSTVSKLEQDWETKNDALKKEYKTAQKKAYKSCDKSYPASKYMFSANRTCRSAWNKEHTYLNLAKPAKPMKPVLVATDAEKTAPIIGMSIESVSTDAEKWAEPFAKGFFMLYVVLSIILNGLVLRSIFNEFSEMAEDINSDPTLYKKSYEHYETVRRTERHGIAENKQREETETMSTRVSLSSKITDLNIYGEKKKAAIKLKQHHIMEAGGYKGMIQYLRGKGIPDNEIEEMMQEFEDKTEEQSERTQPQPQPKVIQPRREEHKTAAHLTDNTSPIGFKIDKSTNVTPVTKKPTFEKIDTKPVVNAVFDGEDLKIATELLLIGLSAGDKVMNNTKLRDAFKYSEAKGTMALNEVGSFVKIPLANIGVLQENSGKAYTVSMELEEALELLASKGMIHA
jgi:hypothetical protein